MNQDMCRCPRTQCLINAISFLYADMERTLVPGICGTGTRKAAVSAHTGHHCSKSVTCMLECWQLDEFV